jgi:hypothetical protein
MALRALSIPRGATLNGVFDSISNAHSRREGQNAQGIQDAKIAVDVLGPAKLWCDSTSVKKFRFGPPLRIVAQARLERR